MREDSIGVIIVAGVLLAGLTRTLKNRTPVPIADGVLSAIRHCKDLITFTSGGTTEGSFTHPSHKPNHRLPPMLTVMLT